MCGGRGGKGRGGEGRGRGSEVMNQQKVPCQFWHVDGLFSVPPLQTHG